MTAPLRRLGMPLPGQWALGSAQAGRWRFRATRRPRSRQRVAASLAALTLEKAAEMVLVIGKPPWL